MISVWCQNGGLRVHTSLDLAVVFSQNIQTFLLQSLKDHNHTSIHQEYAVLCSYDDTPVFPILANNVHVCISLL